MIRGFYASAAGMLTQLNRNDVLSSNLSNAESVAFKEGHPVAESFPALLVRQVGGRGGPGRAGAGQAPLGLLSAGTWVGAVSTDFSQGTVYRTGNPQHFALRGDGFFAVEDQSGQTVLTRRGDFHLGANGQLLTSESYGVMGQDGPVFFPGKTEGVDVQVGDLGEIFFDGQRVGQLSIFEVKDPENLTRLDHGYFGQGTANVTFEPSEPVTVMRGFLEGSNVDLNRTVVSTVEVLRAYEANQHLAKAQDEIMGKAAQEIGRL